MFRKTTLKNGLRIITVPMQSTKTVTVLVATAAGSKYENKKNNGISHFLEHLFFKGTKKRPNTLAISEELDRVGGAYNAFTSEEHTGYWAKVGHKHLGLALDVISDMFLNSKFDSAEIEREKGVITEEINMYQDTPMQYVGTLFDKLLYGDQPAGWFLAGTKENVASFKREDFVQYRREHYSAKNTVVCIAGKVQSSKFKVQNYFKKIKDSKPKLKRKVVESQTKPKTLIHHKNTDQTHFCLGVRGYSLAHPDKYAMSILAVILGGMMSSRLWIAVRARQGLAYYVHTSSEFQTDTGSLVTQAGVEHSKAQKAIQIILKEYTKLRDKKVTVQELKKAQENIKGKMMLELESSDSLASFACTQEILKREILTPEQVFKKIDTVSANDIQKVSRDIFQNKKLNLAVICPKDVKFKTSLGF